MVQLAEEAVAVEAQVSAADARGAKKPLSGSEFSAVVAAVTSAFGDPTRRQVYLHVRDSAAGVTASQVAMHFSLHPNVARHHLDTLAAGGYLEVFSARGAHVGAGAAGAGRPSKLYRASGGLVPSPARGVDLLVADRVEDILPMLRDAARAVTEAEKRMAIPAERL